MSLRYKQRRDIARRIRLILAERFPNAFCARGHRVPKRPLAIDIHKEVIDNLNSSKFAIPVEHIMIAIKDYTGGSSYLQICVEGAPRYDTDGNQRGMVTAEQAQWAGRRLASGDKQREQPNRKRSRDFPPTRRNVA